MNEELAEMLQMAKMYIIMCADPLGELVQQALREVPWEERKKKLGIERDIGEDALQLASDVIKARGAGDEEAWQHACQVFHDDKYDEDEVSDALLLQRNVLEEIAREVLQ